MTVVPFRARPSQELCALALLQHIIREAARHLSHAEFRLLVFLADVITASGSTQALVTSRFIEEGDELTAGIGIGRSQIIRHMRSLEEKKLIFVDRSRFNGLVVSLGFDIADPAAQR